MLRDPVVGLANESLLESQTCTAKKLKVRGRKRLRKFKGMLGIGIGCSEKQSTRTAKSTAEFWRF